VGLYINNDFSYRVKIDIDESSSSCEILAVELLCEKWPTLLLMCMYRPPDDINVFNIAFEKLLA